MMNNTIELLESVLIESKKLVHNTGQIEGVPGNPRCITKVQKKRLASSIEDSPDMMSARELLVYPFGKKYVILAGNQRYDVMKELGYKQMPCKIVPSGATPAQLRAYIIKDNVEFGEWDEDMLSSDWSMDELDSFGMDDVDKLDIKEPCVNQDRQHEHTEDVNHEESTKRASASDCSDESEHEVKVEDAASDFNKPQPQDVEREVEEQETVTDTNDKWSKPEPIKPSEYDYSDDDIDNAKENDIADVNLLRCPKCGHIANKKEFIYIPN